VHNNKVFCTSALRSPLSALRSPLSALRSPLSALRSPLSALRSLLSALSSLLSALRSLLSALCSLLSALCSLLPLLFQIFRIVNNNIVRTHMTLLTQLALYSPKSIPNQLILLTPLTLLGCRRDFRYRGGECEFSYAFCTGLSSPSGL
jgi:hypothetical protein